MWKKVRITFLSLIFIYVSIGAYFDLNQNWDKPVNVVLHPINAEGDPLVQKHIDSLAVDDFLELEIFMRNNSIKYIGKPVDFRIKLGRQIYNHPRLPNEQTAESVLKTILWSLEFRWFGLWNKKREDLGADAVMYLNYYNVDEREEDLSRSTALQRGRIGVVNLFAQYEDESRVIILHEILHTFGAEDRYSYYTGYPNFPEGFAEPNKEPLLPQVKAEIMGSYIPINENDFIIPRGLSMVVMNDITAGEIGWKKSPD